MREHGTRFELVRMRPHDHIGWVFSGVDEFDALARPFLAEGASRGERLMYVAEDPGPDSLAGFAETLAPGALSVASIAEVYGASGIVDAPSQRATFAGALDEALGEGYTGIRVAADNTPLVLHADRLSAWMAWEVVADRFMSEHAVTGLCAFDDRRVDMGRLRHLATLHPLTAADHGIPQFRLFSDDDALWIDGEVDALAMEHVWMALGHLPAKTDVVVDVTGTTRVGKGVVDGVRQLCEVGIGVTIRAPVAAARHTGFDDLLDRGLAWVEV